MIQSIYTKGILPIYLVIFTLLFLFTIELGAQVQVGEDIDGEALQDRSGTSVSLSADGSRVAIGAPLNDGDDGASNLGHVRVFDLIEGVWTQVGSDIDGENSSQLGTSVSISANGSRLAVGAPFNGALDIGHVRVYDFVEGDWSQVGSDIDGEARFDQSGRSVSLSADGNRLAVGSNFNDGALGANTGHVRIYDFEGEDWSQVGSEIDGETADDRSGVPVSISRDGNRIAIGAPRNDGSGVDAGHVRVYELLEGDWSQIGDDINGENEGDRSGFSVALSGDGSRVAIGAQNNDGAAADAGHVKVFDWVGGAWNQVGADIDGESILDAFGSSVSFSMDGSRLAIGARRASISGAGHVKIYDYLDGNVIGGEWSQVGVNLDGEGNLDEFGSTLSLSVDGSRLAVGAPSNPGMSILAGHVRVFDLPQATLPVDLVVFEGSAQDGKILLTWETESETNNVGFYLEHSLARTENWQEIDFIDGAGTSSSERSYSYLSPDLPPGLHRFRLQQLDLDGTRNTSSEIEVYLDFPGTHLLSAAYPNPFNPETHFELTLGLEQHVHIAVFDAMGRQVQELHDGRLSAKTAHRFRIDSAGLPTGVYLYQVTGEAFSESRSVLLSK